MKALAVAALAFFLVSCGFESKITCPGLPSPIELATDQRSLPEQLDGITWDVTLEKSIESDGITYAPRSRLRLFQIELAGKKSGFLGFRLEDGTNYSIGFAQSLVGGSLSGNAMGSQNNFEAKTEILTLHGESAHETTHESPVTALRMQLSDNRITHIQLTVPRYETKGREAAQFVENEQMCVVGATNR